MSQKSDFYLFWDFHNHLFKSQGIHREKSIKGHNSVKKIIISKNKKYCFYLFPIWVPMQKISFLGRKVRAVDVLQTDRQTNKQTNKHTQNGPKTEDLWNFFFNFYFYLFIGGLILLNRRKAPSKFYRRRRHLAQGAPMAPKALWLADWYNQLFLQTYLTYL